MKLSKTRQFLTIAISCALWSSASNAMATQYYSSPDEQPVTCTTPDTAIQAAKLLRAHAKEELITPVFRAGKCLIRAADTRFEVIESHQEYSEVRFPNTSASEVRYIAGAAESLKGPFNMQRDEKVYPPGCREPGGGEVDRMEAGPDGQLYLKRYFITEKCVNGQMRSFTKRLN